MSHLLVGNAKSQAHIELLLAPCAQAAAGTPRQSLPPWSRPGIPVPALLTCSKSAEAPTAFGQRARLGWGRGGGGVGVGASLMLGTQVSERLP